MKPINLILWAVALLLLAVPLLLLVKISLAEPVLGVPPYSPLFDAHGLQMGLHNFSLLLGDGFYRGAAIQAVLLAAATALGCALIGWPLALAVQILPPASRAPIIGLLLAPFLVALLLRVYGWMNLLSPTGMVNDWLLAWGMIDAPLVLYPSWGVTWLVMIACYLPLLLLPLLVQFHRLPDEMLQAAADLGANLPRQIYDVLWPWSRGALIAGMGLVFVPAMGEYVVPALLGGGDVPLLGRVIYDEFFQNRDWPLASALALLLLLLVTAPIWAMKKTE